MNTGLLAPLFTFSICSILTLVQLDSVNTGKISAGDAAQFLKTSGLSDSTLGKVGHRNPLHDHTQHT